MLLQDFREHEFAVRKRTADGDRWWTYARIFSPSIGAAYAFRSLRGARFVRNRAQRRDATAVIEIVDRNGTVSP